MSTVLIDAEPGDRRRSSARYPIAANVAYRLTAQGSNLCEGRGRSVNMSSSGILLATETPMPLGVDIALEIAWPAKLDQFVALKLHVEGRTVRAIGNSTAVAIARYEFRTRGWNPDQLPGRRIFPKLG